MPLRLPRRLGWPGLLALGGLVALAGAGVAQVPAGPLTAAQGTPLAPHRDARFVPREVVVRFRRDARPAERRAAREGSGVAFEDALMLPRTQLVRTGGQSVSEAVERLERDPSVLYAEPNFIYEPAAPPTNDPRFGELWGLPAVNALTAWDATRGAGQVIAIVDSGVAYNHPDLAANIWTNPGEIAGNWIDDDDNGVVDDVRGYDFADGDTDPDDAGGHGTHVAGIAAAVADNGLGIAGVAHQAKIMALRNSNASGFTLEGNANSVVYAAIEGAGVINASWGGPDHSQLLEDAVSFARAQDAVVVVSAMNNASDNDAGPAYPCNLPQPNLICVASIDPDGALSDFSNFGATTVDVGAPGRDVLSTWPAFEELFADDFETDIAGRWQSSGTNNLWGRTTARSASPTHSLADSPAGPYANNTSSRIESLQPVDLTGRAMCRLEFLLDLDSEFQVDGLFWGVRDSTGAETELGSAADTSEGEFVLSRNDLRAVEGRTGVRPWFEFASNGSVTGDGAYIDDLALGCRKQTWEEASAYRPFDGTSMAAPHVAGVAALVRAAVPGANADEVARAIKDSVVPLPSLQGKTVTGGKVDAAAAIQEATADTTAPAVTLVTPSDGSSSNDTTPTYGGEAGDGAGDSLQVTVKVYAGGAASGTPVRTHPALRSGTSWAVAGSPPLAPGTYTAQAEQEDAAGNTGLSGESTFSVGERVFSLAPPFEATYTIDELGAPPGIPARLGGLTVKAGSTDRLLIGGGANEASGAMYEIGVARDASGHITGFSGAATRFADAAFNDGGVAYGPGDVLFLARYAGFGQQALGQTKPGSSLTDKIVALAPFGVAHSPGAVGFVPAGRPGAGSLKLLSWPGGQWYDAAVTPDGTGTFNLQNVTQVAGSTLPGGPDGLAYVNQGSPQFAAASVLVTEFSADKVAAYEVNGDGDPVVATRRDFLTGLNEALGAAIDPVTGDFLFSTFELGGGTVIVVRGFAPTPGTLRVVKEVVNDHGGTRSAGDFSVHVKAGGTDVAGSPKPGDAAGTSYTLPPGSYTVSEDAAPGYTGSLSGDCNASGQVTLLPGETSTCTIVNDDVDPAGAPTLRVIKQVVNDDGGTRTAAQFTMRVKSGGAEVAGSPHPGSASGTTHRLTPGTFDVSEDPVAGYRASFSGACDAQGRVTLTTGDAKTCTVTNDDVAPTLRVVTEVVNDHGGGALASAWTMHIRAGIPLLDVAGSPFVGSAVGVMRTLPAGSYAVGQSGGPGGYAGPSFRGDCDALGRVTVAVGESKTCVVTSDDVAPPPPPPPQPPDPDPPVTRSCLGVPATHAGTNGDDVIRGTRRADVIVAGAGDDVIEARDGRDLICAGAGNDGIRGGFTQDRGPDGADRILGGAGNDVMSGNQGNDVIWGEAGNDTINGGTGRDACSGGSGNNRLRACEASAPPPPVGGSCMGVAATHMGTNGPDFIRGTIGADVIVAGGGDDVIEGRDGRDLVCAGAGNDGIRGGYTQDRGPDSADRIFGGDGSDVMSGNQGNDVLHGEGGNDTINGGTGRDECSGGPGRNTLRACEG